MLPNYTYKALVLNIVDGDTIDVEIDAGFHIKIKHRIRFLRVNTAETNSKDPDEKKLALAAKNYTIECIANKNIILTTYKSDAFGRYLAEIYYDKDGKQICLNDELLELNLARIYK
jgi:micrococcal nuclease